MYVCVCPVTQGHLADTTQRPGAGEAALNVFVIAHRRRELGGRPGIRKARRGPKGCVGHDRHDTDRV